MSLAAPRYAQALLELSQEQNNIDQVYSALIGIGGLVKNVAEFRNFISNPLLSYEERSSVIQGLFSAKLPDVVVRFLLFISYKNRLNQLPQIIEDFDALYLNLKNEMRVTIETALPLPPNSQQIIKDHLKQKFHKEILADWKMLPSMIGGFKIMAQGTLYDYSFKNQLNSFVQSMNKD